MEYRIISTVGSKKLEILINEAIQKGWTPIGGVSYAPGGYDFICAQAMIYNKRRR